MILTSEPKKDSEELMVCNIFLKKGSGLSVMVEDAEDVIAESTNEVL